MEILPIFSFLTGVISILTPCIIPILPLFVTFCLNTKRKMELFSFICGFISIFLLVIILTAFFTSALYSYIVYVRIFSSILLMIIGILLLINHSMNFSIKAKEFNNTLANSFIFGLLTCISWSPCFGPYLISLISLIVNTNNVTYALFNIILYCVGFSLTLTILSILLSRIDLEKLARKSKYISKIFAIIIILTSANLLLSSINVIL